MGARYRRSVSILIAGGIESLTILGGFGGLLLGHAPTPAVVGGIFALVGGGFVYLVYNALGGALTHQMHLPRARGITAELASFVCTGAIFWASGRF